MPKKRQSQPVQIWLANKDLLRLQHAAKKTDQTQSAIAREAIVRLLDELEKDDKERTLQNQHFKGFSKESLSVMHLAKGEAESTQSLLIGSEHLLLALAVETGPSGKLLCKFGLSPSLLRARIASGWPSVYAGVVHPPYSPTLMRILDRARLSANRSHDRYVQPEHLLLAVLAQGNGFAFNILEGLGLPRGVVIEAMKKQLPKLRQERRWKRKSR